MEELTDEQRLLKVITDCCETKRSIDINMFDPTSEDTDKAWGILGDKYKRKDSMQSGCLVAHLEAQNICGYGTVEITMFRKREKKGGDEE